MSTATYRLLNIGIGLAGLGLWWMALQQTKKSAGAKQEQAAPASTDAGAPSTLFLDGLAGTFMA